MGMDLSYKERLPAFSCEILEAEFLLYNHIMKILIATGLFPPEVGGPATYAKLLLEELPKKGIEVSVLPFSEVRRLPKIVRHFVYFFKALRLARKADVVLALDPVSVGLPAIFAAKIAGKRFFVKVVGDYAWEQLQNLESRILNLEKKFISLEEFQGGKYGFITEVRRKIERYVAKNAERVIVPSKYLKGIVEVWGVSSEKIKVIYNAFDVPTFSESRESVREKLNIQGRMFLSAGRMVPWKGFDTLINLMPEIVREIPDARLYIAGDGPQENYLRQIVKDKDLQDSVVFLGRLNQIGLFKYIRASDIFILNTGYEGFSHQLLEVASLGTSVITTNIGGNPELVEDGVSGILVEYNDKAQIKFALTNLVKDNEKRLKLAETAKNKVLNFNTQKMIEELINTII